MPSPTFSCHHSGKCCEKIYTQINITIGDILRILSYTNLTLQELFNTYISITPFASEDKDIFDYDIGLNIPCRFRKDKRCSIYKARPLNCRIFPYWIFAEVPEEHIRDVVDETYECVHNIKLNNKTKKRYKEYAKNIGNLILEESRITELFLKEIGFKKSINISKHTPSIESKLKDKFQEIELSKKIDEEKIKLCLSLLNKEEVGETLTNLTKKIEESKTTMKFADLDEIEKIESIKLISP